MRLRSLDKEDRDMKRISTIATVVSVLIVHLIAGEALGGLVVRWNFSNGPQGWTGNHHVTDLTCSREGLSFQSTSVDPWIEGPPIDLPGDRLTRVTVRMRSTANSSGELFYGPYFQAGRSVRFTVRNDGLWHDYELVIMELLGAGTRFRLDPATTAGQIGVASILIETLTVYADPPYQRPSRPGPARGRTAEVASGSLRVKYLGAGIGDLVAEVAGWEMASTYDRELLGALCDDSVEWLDIRNAHLTIGDGVGIDLLARLTDSRGAVWQIRRTLSAGPMDGVVVVESQIQVSEDREVMCMPWLTLFAGLGTFGPSKNQGLFAGLEYLEDEPSSSEADITTVEHVRRVPDPVKVTFPLMAIAAQGYYIGLIWEPSEWVGPLFDTPDTIFGSGAHVMGLTGPAVGKHRFENALVAHTPIHLEANTPVATTMWIVGGEGETVVPAVQQYVGLRGLPPVPQMEGGLPEAARLLAHGWLHSAIRERGLFRHAGGGDLFGAGPAPDAAMFMDWLAATLDASEKGRSDLVEELSTVRDMALASVPSDWHFDGGVSHVRPPTPALLFGDVAAYVERRHSAAQQAIARFNPDGIRVYQPGTVDYGTTHFANHANGYGASDLVTALEGATLRADPAWTQAALELLDKQTLLYANTVPRGAQTWEIPLHTPDILAAGLLTKAYTLGYVISRRDDLLEQARYWAWTGVPFVYLVSQDPVNAELQTDLPSSNPDVGPYATIPVLGATGWVGSWFGRPVQWCGLVYASALRLLAPYDPQGPWRQIASGITATGLQMAWPVDDVDRQGLLPDYFVLEAQQREGPAINPGTTQAHVPELFDAGAIYDVRRLSAARLEKGESEPEGEKLRGSEGRTVWFSPGLPARSNDSPTFSPSTLLTFCSLGPDSLFSKSADGCFIHAPCCIRDIVQESGRLSFTLDGWGGLRNRRSYHVLVSGWPGRKPHVTLHELDEPPDTPDQGTQAAVQYLPSSKLLVFEAIGPTRVRIAP
jgi:hypothetical protein